MRIQSFSSLIWLALSLVFTPSCDQSTDEMIGLIPAHEIEQLAPLSLEEFAEAYETAIAKEPDLERDEEQLARAIFDIIKSKRSDTKADRMRVASSDSQSLSPYYGLTSGELILVFSFPINAYKASSTVDPAFQAGKESFPCEAIEDNDGKADAVRHAYWNALMTKRTSALFAEAFGTAHESGFGNPEQRKQMDLNNNAVGRRIAVENPSATDEELLEIVLTQPIDFVEKGGAIAIDPSRLVQFRQKEPLDGRYTGKLTDDGYTNEQLAATLSLSQCGLLIRGTLVTLLVSENWTTVRRMTGVLNVDEGVIDFDVAQPRVPLGEEDQYCKGVKARLQVTSEGLTGTWSSSDCDGGTMTLQRAP